MSDAFEKELIEKLKPLRGDQPAAWERLQGELPRRTRRRPVLIGVGLGLAASIAALVLSNINGGREPRRIVTAAGQQRSVAVGALGTVTLQPKGELWVREGKGGVPQMELLRGRLHAVVDAPPRVFSVRTPGAEAVDLGCVYDLQVDEDKSTHLWVHVGEVALAGQGDEVVVPEGYQARASADGTLGPPVRVDADPIFVAEAWAAAQPGPHTGLDRWSALLEAARPEDRETLLFFAARAPPQERRSLERWLAEHEAAFER